MQQTGASTLSTQKSSSDTSFACPNCSTSFVVEPVAGGMTLNCQKCGTTKTVSNPVLEAPAQSALKISGLQHQLKENESQRIEITGYINQLSIQLHRWQLRLKTLKERQEKLQTEFAAISGPTAK
jgi:DNA-directed RNA polymerase subunit M/transcription elongation factor TFIIS